jgi:ubiquinone/menaquinone biosynthesis C-methylase UbiE
MLDRVDLAEHWEREALNWAAWTRGPTADAYADYGPLFMEFLPPPGRRALEIGCGEGRVTRDLRAHGYAITGLDVSPTLVRLASQADPGTEYRAADAAGLPFPDAAFDLVVAYNSLMDVDDLVAVLREAARVLLPGGVFAACVTHPIVNAGTFVAPTPEAP